MFDIAVVILNWNASADTLRCLGEIALWHELQPEVWVVDNASSDGSAGTIAEAFPAVQLIRSRSNLGYAGGNNLAIASILNRNSRFILLLNNDATISQTDVLTLAQTLDTQAHLGIIGPPLFDAAQKERLLTAGGQNMVRHLTSHIHQLAPTPVVQTVDYVPGTVMLIKREVFAAVGLLDEAYFFNAEIPDFCWRAKQHGCDSAIHTQTRGYHAVSRSSKFRETLYTYYIIRNRFLFIGKFHHRLEKLRLTSFWAAYSLALAAKVQLDGKPHSARAIWLGLRDGLQGRFGGQNERVLAACKV
jgi:hypothetical protein